MIRKRTFTWQLVEDQYQNLIEIENNSMADHRLIWLFPRKYKVIDGMYAYAGGSKKSRAEVLTTLRDGYIVEFNEI